jgi:hypothetical protein
VDEIHAWHEPHITYCFFGSYTDYHFQTADPANVQIVSQAILIRQLFQCFKWNRVAGRALLQGMTKINPQNQPLFLLLF